MTPERWLRVKAVLAKALEKNALAREDFVNKACGDDHQLRDEVQSLLAQEQRTDTLLRRPLLDSAIELQAWLRSPSGARPPTVAPGPPAAYSAGPGVASHRRPPAFFWLAAALSTIFLILYVHAAWIVYQYGN